MAWQPENLTPQIDGVVTSFTTTFMRVLAQLQLHYTPSGGDTVLLQLGVDYSEPNSKTITLTSIVPVVGDELQVDYLTDETVEARVLGFAQDPGSNPPIPQSLVDVLDDLDNRIDALETSSVKGTERSAKDSVRAATTADIGATYNSTGGPCTNGQFTAAPNAIDGVALVLGDRILVKDQSGSDENGIWVISTLGTGADGVWDRAEDFNADSEVTQGARTAAIEGTTNGETFWGLVTPNPITIGTGSGTGLTFEPVGGGGGVGGADAVVAVTATFNFNTTTPLDFGILASGDEIIDSEIFVTVAFDDPSALLALGQQSIPGNILSTAANDPTVVGTYTSAENFLVTGADAIRLNITPGASTVGSGRVTVIVRKA